MTTTDTDALKERIARTVHVMQDRIMPWSEENEVYKHDARKIAAAILPIVAGEVRKAKAEALREAAGPEWGNNNTLWSGPRVRAKINRRAAEYETGDSDEQR